MNRPLGSADMDAVHALWRAQEAEGRALVTGEAVPVEEVRVARFADMQFVGQTHLLRVPLGTDLPSREDLQARFERAYHDRFHVALRRSAPTSSTSRLPSSGAARRSTCRH